MTALLTIILSFIGALVCGLMPASEHRRIRWVALAVAAAGLVVSMVCCVNYSGGNFEVLVNEQWIQSLKIRFIIGYDGIRNAADGGRNTRQTSSCCFEIDEPKALHLS